MISPALLAEYEETVIELRQSYPDRPCVDWVGALRDEAEIVFPDERVVGVTADPFDAMILECAWSSRADAIVSGDKKHLLILENFRGIPIRSPADFLRSLGHLD